MLTSLEVLRRARRIVFVQVNEHEFLTIIALRDSMEVSWWGSGMSVPLKSHRVARSAESLSLFNGYAWNIERLIDWIHRHCPVCWNTLTNARQIYDTKACKQKAYRQRLKMAKGLFTKYSVTNIETGEAVEGVFVLKPETDLHARRALLSYAESTDFENPTLATDLRAWVNYLTVAFPIQIEREDSFDYIPDWLREQSKGQT